MLRKYSKKNLMMLGTFFLFFDIQICTSFNSINIPKEMFSSILGALSKSKTIPLIEEEWSPQEKKRGFGGSSINRELFNFIRSILPERKVLLELGSGWTSGQFSQYYTVYSIEHDRRWLGKYKTNYIYAPIKNRWYNPAIVKEKLPAHYDLILVDGPPGFGSTGRDGFFTHLDLFKTDITIIFDDVNRKAEYKLMIKVGQRLQRDAVVFGNQSQKKFGVIYMS